MRTGSKRTFVGGVQIALLVAASIVASPDQAAAQNFSCNNPGSIPPITLPPQFNFWGPSAVCATATAAGAISAAVNTANTAFLTSTSAFVGSPPRAPDSSGGGVWVRGVGGRVDITSGGTATAAGAVSLPGNGIPFTSLTVDSKTRTEFGGIQFGGDLGRFNLGGSGWNAHFGLTGGWLGSSTRNLIGVGGTEIDIPFVGFYGVVTSPTGFYADVLVRYDHYDMNVANANVGLTNGGFSGNNWSVTASAGYNVSLGSGWFIEPSAGVIWSNLKVDPLAIPGGGPFGVPAGTATFSDVESLLGRAGLRIGTSFTTATLAISPYVVASVWHEFADASRTSFACGGCAFSLDVSTSRIGTYGQFGLGVAAQVIDTGWLGYARVDYRTGDNIEGWAANVGIRYQWGAPEVPSRPLVTKG